MMPYTVGLTGGIGSGKTRVSTMFAAHGVCIIDTDQIARTLVSQDSVHLREIVAHFGQDILLPDGTLDRPALRHRIFGADPEKAWLEALLHPAIRAEVHEALATCKGPYAMIVVPLLAETQAQGYAYLDRILVVDTSPALQLTRTMARDNLTETQADLILRKQAPREIRLAMAHDIIDNTGSEAELQAQVDHLHTRYLKLSQHSSLQKD